ncbi:trans-sialidase [Trypanosoma rangeli]|uniref:Trans-sialidase n=1 Tax=Trypanosoma rangeli TaxID=5698 RepID=A0A3R7MZK2_TRYRA|nr:trans-sialidase [Trypanosoma rangeli]RNE97654.1 trans-sialidase [Trypanosoma rangeli]|eukprot:RNE97654.1 trans-sialidase [Trypanosoma rangeli]
MRQAAFFLCPSPSSCSGSHGWAACSSPVPADGLVGFWSGAGNATQWAGDYRWMNATVSGATRIADGFNMTGPASRIVRPVIERAGAPAYSFGGRERGLARAGAEHELRREEALADGRRSGSWLCVSLVWRPSRGGTERRRCRRAL